MIEKNHDVPKKNRIYLMIIQFYLVKFIRYILLLPLVGVALLHGFKAAAAVGKPSSLYTMKPISNTYALYMTRDICNKEIAYQASKQYENKWRIFILDKSKAIMHLPFINHTYKFDFEDKIKEALDKMKRDFGMEYQFVESMSKANFLILFETWPEDFLEKNYLGVGFNKGFSDAESRFFLNKKNIGLEFGGVILPDEESIVKILPKIVEGYYNDFMKEGVISKSLTPENFLSMFWVFIIEHEFGHSLGFLHADLVTNKRPPNSELYIKLEDQEQYDTQPPIMTTNIEFFRLLQKWRGYPISSITEIAASLQESDGYHNAQLSKESNLESRANSGNSGIIKNKAGAEFKCHDYKITFGDD